MAVDLRNFEQVIEHLRSKIVHTARGEYIAVNDLRKLVLEERERRAQDQEEEAERGPIRTFEQAKVAAKKDFLLKAALDKSPIAIEGVKS